MPWYDMPLERLREYRTETPEPDGLDGWWAQRLDLARSQGRPATFTPYEPDVYRPFQVFDVEFSGAGGDPVRAWHIMLLPALGYAVLVMDSRGQGGRWTFGATGDRASGPENSQVMTRGITTPEDYYYTRMFTDAARAVDVALELAGPSRQVAVTGHSQGGALALAAAALQSDRVAVCHADAPFLCDIQRAITLAPHAPYTEIPEFLAENMALVGTALHTLRYIDCALLARRITATCLLSVALMDDTCPPSTVFAAYNEITSDKDIIVYPYSGHAVAHSHAEHQLRHLRWHLPPARPERRPSP